jgi:GNAT superfamily N-acetyltransferase
MDTEDITSSRTLLL